MVTESQRKHYYGTVLPNLISTWQKVNQEKLSPKKAHSRVKLIFKFKTITTMSESEFDNLLIKIKALALSEFDLFIR